MIPEHLSYGGGGGDAITPITIILVLVTCLFILFGPRKKVLYAFLLGALLIPFGQRIVIGGTHLQMLRIFIFFAWIRVILSRRATSELEKGPFGKLVPIDRAFVYYTIAAAITFVLLYQEWAAANYQLGAIYSALGLYFLLRVLIRDKKDVIGYVKTLVIVCAIAAATMLVELLTGGKNLFGFVGGVPMMDGFREGHLRAQAFFENPIIAGSVGATILPLSVWLWLQGPQYKKYGILCFLSSTVMTLSSGSSTPVLAYLAGILAFAFWPLRSQMRWVRRGVVFILVSLHMVMKAPVWNLIARVDVFGGSSGDHRYQLVNQCILHFWDWWLVGTKDNANWGWDMWDTANLYVGTAEAGGLIGLILLIMLLSRSFRSVGLAREAAGDDSRNGLMYWSLGAALFVQCVAFIGIAYYDQSVVVWYGLLAIIVGATAGLSPVIAKTPPEIARFGIPLLARDRLGAGETIATREGLARGALNAGTRTR